MAKVICTLPNASELINGVKFVSHKLGMISEEIEDEIAEGFLAIEGYISHGKGSAKAAAQQTSAQTPVASEPEETDSAATQK